MTTVEQTPQKRSAEGRERANRETWQVIEPFAEMGMYPRDIRVAVIIEKRKNFSQPQISETLGWARSNAGLPELTAEEKKNIVKYANAGFTQVEDRVIKWLVAKEILVKKGAEIPRNRSEWLGKIETMGEIDESLSTVKSLLSRGGSVSEVTEIAELNLEPAADPIVRFAQELMKAEMITVEDLSDHNYLRMICRNKNIELSFVESVVLEALLVARKRLHYDKDISLISKYSELRDDVFVNKGKEDSSLVKLENFIGEIEINDSDEHGVDGLGLYRRDKDGNKWRTLVGTDDDGNPVYDNPDLRAKREDSRRRINEAAERTRSKKLNTD